MLKLLLITLLSISVFGVEIVIDITSQMPQTLVEKKEMVLQKAKQEHEFEQEEAKRKFEEEKRRNFERKKALEERNRYRRDNEKEVVKDTKLKIMWQDDKRVESVNKDWSDAKDYCQNLTHAGYDDWYLPTIQELESIVDISRYRPAIKEVFKNMSFSWSSYWSSSALVSDSLFAWYVHFEHGYSGLNDKTDENYVKCVRAGQ